MDTGLIEAYINRRGGLQKKILDEIAIGEQNNAIDLVYGSIFWCDYNLVYGPTNRWDDPGDSTDYAILFQQEIDYQEKYTSML